MHSKKLGLTKRRTDRQSWSWSGLTNSSVETSRVTANWRPPPVTGDGSGIRTLDFLGWPHDHHRSIAIGPLTPICDKITITGLRREAKNCIVYCDKTNGVSQTYPVPASDSCNNLDSFWFAPMVDRQLPRVYQSKILMVHLLNSTEFFRKLQFGSIINSEGKRLEKMWVTDRTGNRVRLLGRCTYRSCYQ